MFRQSLGTCVEQIKPEVKGMSEQIFFIIIQHKNSHSALHLSHHIFFMSGNNLLSRSRL